MKERLELFVRWVAGTLLIVAVWLLRATWRVRVVGRPPSGPALIAAWHGDQLPLTFLPRPMGALVSRSADGELAARVLRALGFDVIRGSSSRGAVAGALGVLRALRGGSSVAVTVDGPRGPRHRTDDSLARLGRCASVPVVVVAASARRYLLLRSWDRMLIPAPFTAVTIAWGAEIDEQVERHLEAHWQATSCSLV